MGQDEIQAGAVQAVAQPAGRTAGRAKRGLRRLVTWGLPAPVRRRLALFVERQAWLDPARRHRWSMELVRDLADTDANAFHAFLWSNHLGYASSYEVAERFGPENVKLSRRMFFTDLVDHLGALGLPRLDQVGSVFEVGCSLGYQLRLMETELFPGATELEGIDIDRYAIEAGADHLRRQGSKVVLRCADTRELGPILGGRTFDLIVCTGVLMYLTEPLAAAAVDVMLSHGRAVALSGLAHPDIDNARLDRSDVRARDNTFIHNFDRLVESAGGTVVFRRWEGSRDVDGNTIYFVFARRT